MLCAQKKKMYKKMKDLGKRKKNEWLHHAEASYSLLKRTLLGRNLGSLLYQTPEIPEYSVI